VAGTVSGLCPMPGSATIVFHIAESATLPLVDRRSLNGSQSRETEKYAHESRGTRNQE
jgi:hypothetical protein